MGEAGHGTGAVDESTLRNFTTNANNIQSALAALTNIGAGNISVTHDPLRNAQNQITENRRFKVEFVNGLGHQNLMPVTGSGTGLTRTSFTVTARSPTWGETE